LGLRGVDDDGAGGGGRAGGVFRDVVNGVLAGVLRVERYGGDGGAVEEKVEPQVGVGLLRAGDAGAEVDVAVANVEVGGVVALDFDDRGLGWVRRRICNVVVGRGGRRICKGYRDGGHSGAALPLVMQHHATEPIGARRGVVPMKSLGRIAWRAHMRTVFVAAFLMVFGIASAFAQETCESKAIGANGKPLAGAAKKTFLQKCKKDACEPKAVDSNGKPLKGAAKKSFLKKCEKGA
jgi:hypothetical protein